MKNIDVIKAFVNGKSACGSNLYSTGDKLVNYNTCIAEYNENENRYILNITKYSSTTSRHQNALRKLLPLGTICVNKIPKGTLNLLRYG
jgi:hypothetical protein